MTTQVINFKHQIIESKFRFLTQYEKLIQGKTIELWYLEHQYYTVRICYCDLFINSTFSLCVLYPHKDKSMTQAVQNNEGRLYEIKEIIRFIFLANYFIFFPLNCLISFLNFATKFLNDMKNQKMGFYSYKL